MSAITKEKCSDTYSSHDDFLPCPFCGSNHIHHESVRGSRYARCQTCSTTGGYVFDFQEVEFSSNTVLERWNSCKLRDDFGDADRTAEKLVAENIALEAHNSVLMSALEDMLLLIEEHGVKSVIRFHAKRIAEARKALKVSDERIFDENPFIPDSNGFPRGGEG